MPSILHIPDPDHITNTNTVLPYVFVGDEAFQLMDKMMMKPYPREVLASNKQVYNYWLSRARGTIENIFGIF